MAFFQAKVLKTVQAGMQYVPEPVRRAMKTTPVLTGCIVVGGAFTAYGSGHCTGSQAIAGAAIGLGTVTLHSIPVGKMLKLAISFGKR